MLPKAKLIQSKKDKCLFKHTLTLIYCNYGYFCCSWTQEFYIYIWLTGFWNMWLPACTYPRNIVVTNPGFNRLNELSVLRICAFLNDTFGWILGRFFYVLAKIAILARTPTHKEHIYVSVARKRTSMRYLTVQILRSNETTPLVWNRNGFLLWRQYHNRYEYRYFEIFILSHVWSDSEGPSTGCIIKRDSVYQK